MEIKYTTEGKKVVVIGNLNTTDVIVQEIFVSGNGAEIPSGENFVVKSLHDEPVVSWKEKKLKEVESNYEYTIKRYEQDAERLRNTHKMSSDLLENKIRQMKLLEKNISEKDLETFIMIATCQCKYLVIEGYSGPEIVEFDKEIQYNDSYGYNYNGAIKLISLLGRSDGSLSFRVHNYSDSSGSGEKVIHPFRTIEEANNKAISILKDWLKDKSVHFTYIDMCKKYNVEIPNEKLIEFFSKEKESLTRMIGDAKKALLDKENAASELDLKISQLTQ